MEEMEYRFDVFRATNGAHREVYLVSLKNFNIYSSFCNNLYTFVSSFDFVKIF